MRLILFDADGTLIDSQSIIHESMRLTFLRFGYEEPTPEHTRSIIGLTLDRAISTILHREVDEEILDMTAEYKNIYIGLSKLEEMKSLPFRGIPSLVRKLAAQEDTLLGIVTGKSRRGVRKMLETVHFENVFVTSRCADDCPSKPHPAMVLECCDEVGIRPAHTLVIGDTGFDMEMAVSAGATALGVSWGYHSVHRIAHAGAHHIANTIGELETAIGDWRLGQMLVSGTDERTLPVVGAALQHA